MLMGAVIFSGTSSTAGLHFSPQTGTSIVFHQVSHLLSGQDTEASFTTMRQERNHMKYNYDRLVEAKKAVALVNACSVSIDQAINVALSSVGGTIFDAQLKEVEQRVVWRVKLLTSGGRVKMYIDARSGRVIEAKAEITFDENHRWMTPEGALSSYPTTLKSVPRL